MGVQFNGSSQYLQYDNPTAFGYPFSVGCWFLPLSVTTTTRCVHGVVNSTTTGTGWDLEYDSSNGLGFWSGVNSNWLGAAVAAPTAGQWHYALCRGISATNRRLSCLYPNGSSAHAQNTTSSSPTGTTTLSLGVLRESTPILFMDGFVAEYWFASVDVVPGGGVTPDSILQQLAFKGPFSLRHIADKILVYRSLFRSAGSDADAFGEQAWGTFAPQTWANVNGAQLAPHPPLAPDYMRPADFRQLMPV